MVTMATSETGRWTRSIPTGAVSPVFFRPACAFVHADAIGENALFPVLIARPLDG
jgi:hypothetical protein